MNLQIANLALRFLLELCGLAAFGYWGFQFGRDLLTKIGLGIGTPLLVAFIWGLFVAPGASMKLQGTSLLIAEIVIFGLAAIALYSTKHPVLANTFVLFAILNRVLMYIWKQ